MVNLDEACMRLPCDMRGLWGRAVDTLHRVSVRYVSATADPRGPPADLETVSTLASARDERVPSWG